MSKIAQSIAGLIWKLSVAWLCVTTYNILFSRYDKVSRQKFTFWLFCVIFVSEISGSYLSSLLSLKYAVIKSPITCVIDLFSRAVTALNFCLISSGNLTCIIMLFSPVI